MNKLIVTLLLTSGLIIGCHTEESQESKPLAEIPYEKYFEPQPSAQVYTPEESMRRIHVPGGYHLELVASEPMIEEPVTLAWDGNGRMYVAEMRTYVQDVDGTGTDDPVSRVMLLEDTDGDGAMDKSSVFIDSLVLPRMILPLDDRVLINETYTYNIHSYRDTDGDGNADEKILVYENDAKDSRNLEHQRSGFIWNIDNWIYATRVPYRYRFVDNKLEVDSLFDFPHGQWGIAMDDYGRMFHSLAGGERPALGFQLNPVYGTVEFDDQFEGDFFATWPIVATPDVQGGPKRMRADSTLNHFTGCSGPSIFRGNNLPADLQGDLIICEPVGRLVRRAKVMNRNGKTVLKNAYHQKEFIAATDMNFRPVFSTTGPDGCLYIVDMYRGIIQESNWTREGSYLREVAVKKGLDKNIGRGRIYRLVHDGYQPGPTPNLLDLSSKELVAHLSHPNGWWRDTAQKLLILKGDLSVVSDLEKLAVGQPGLLDKLMFWQTPTKPATRIHALWTLQGLGALTSEVLIQAFKDPSPEVRKSALWISDNHLKNGSSEILEAVLTMQNDPDPNVRIQLVSTLKFAGTDASREVIETLKDRNADNDLLLVAAELSLQQDNPHLAELKKKIALMHPGSKKQILNGHEIYRQLCAACHGNDGTGVKLSDNSELPAPPLAGSPRLQGDREILAKILLHGLDGPVDGKEYPDIMPPQAHNDDQYLADVLSYVLTDFGEKNATVGPDLIEKVRKEHEGRKAYWTLDELSVRQSSVGSSQ